jgi:hypothetical protein
MSSQTCCSYNIKVNYRNQFLERTMLGHPARWNDETLVLFDDFVVALHEGKKLQDRRLQMYDHDASGKIMKQIYTGV